MIELPPSPTLKNRRERDNAGCIRCFFRAIMHEMIAPLFVVFAALAAGLFFPSGICLRHFRILEPDG